MKVLDCGDGTSCDMRTETVCFCVTNILSGGVDSCSPGPRLACCDPAYFSLEFPDPVCRSASPFPGPFSGPGKEFSKAEWLFKKRIRAN